MLEDRGEKAPARETKMTRFHFCFFDRMWYGGSISGAGFASAGDDTASHVDPEPFAAIVVCFLVLASVHQADVNSVSERPLYSRSEPFWPRLGYKSKFYYVLCNTPGLFCKQQSASLWPATKVVAIYFGMWMADPAQQQIVMPTSGTYLDTSLDDRQPSILRG